jgi:hypothetical protein
VYQANENDRDLRDGSPQKKGDAHKEQQNLPYGPSSLGLRQFSAAHLAAGSGGIAAAFAFQT